MEERIINTFEDLVCFTKIDDADEIRFIEARRIVDEMKKNEVMTLEAAMNSHLFIGSYRDLRQSDIYGYCLDCKVITWDKRKNTYYVVVEPDISQFMSIVTKARHPLLVDEELEAYLKKTMRVKERKINQLS